jgi:acyl-CoA hydrolase
MVVPPSYLFDAGHVLVAVFDTADQAHRAAHDASREPNTRLPLEVTDPAERTSRLVWPDRCESVRWMALERTDPCTVQPVNHAADATTPALAPIRTGAKPAGLRRVR